MPHRGWRFELGRQKLRELSVALAHDFNGDGAPAAAMFMYGLVPALREMLVDPAVAGRRDELALASLYVRWNERPAVGSDIEGRVAVEHSDVSQTVGRATCTVAGRQLCELRIILGTPQREAAPRDAPNEVGARLRVDSARTLAFAAATWDLNPAYWDPGFAAAIGAGRPVAPPGLAGAWLMTLMEERMDRPLTAFELRFLRSPRVGEEATAHLDGNDLATGSVWCGGLPAVSGAVLPEDAG